MHFFMHFFLHFFVHIFLHIFVHVFLHIFVHVFVHVMASNDRTQCINDSCLRVLKMHPIRDRVYESARLLLDAAGTVSNLRSASGCNRLKCWEVSVHDYLNHSKSIYISIIYIIYEDFKITLISLCLRWYRRRNLMSSPTPLHWSPACDHLTSLQSCRE